ncbi:hypothetical protein F442_00387 [Phytophthora nicotianae P10297]|uniref:Uncharacterized protein n=1 Tax=Phytophthora nicotianae P10297 TaxID=1317064 RepID=W3A728_PHYNI|nr:hypothetical protein F442_00387 [Phytophthora nicotianae P10297]
MNQAKTLATSRLGSPLDNSDLFDLIRTFQLDTCRLDMDRDSYFGLGAV